MRLEYVPAFLFIPLVGRWVIYPLCKALGRAALLLTSWVLLLFAFTSLDPSNGKGHDLGALGCLGASLLGFALMARMKPPIPAPRILTWLARAATGFLDHVAGSRGPDRAHTLSTLCERRVGQPVIAACRAHVPTPQGHRVQVIALTHTHIFWLQHHPWRHRVGRVLAWRPVAGLVPHTAPRRFGRRQLLELSWPCNCELFTGELRGVEADRFVGQLTASHFQRAPARST